MKKTVNILIMETKPLSLDLMKKAIQSKPDGNYRLKIIGTAETAKAGYFELYKHKPHILFLNPELPDENGHSFIQHALERLPQLKILPMISRFQDEQSYLDVGAYGIINLPMQKAAVWRKMDHLLQELNESGVLEHFQDVAQEDSTPNEPAKELFVLDDPTEKEFNPIFENIGQEVDVLDEESNKSEHKNDTNGNDSSEKESLNSSIIVDDEMEVIDFIEKESDVPTEHAVESSNESEELLVFNPFEPKNDDQDSDDSSKTTGNIPDSGNEHNKSHNDELSIFTFDEEENSGEEPEQEALSDKDSIDSPSLTETEQVPSSEKTESESSPLFHLLDTDEEPSQSTDLFDSDQQEHTEQDDEAPTPCNPPIEGSPLFDFHETTNQSNEEDNDIEKEAEQPEGESVPLFKITDESPEENPDQSIGSTDKGSNHPQTPESLYLKADEYNKTTQKVRKSFEEGFHTSDGSFVSLFPPRDTFGKVDHETIVDMPSEADETAESDGGLLFSVKKLFQKR